MLKQFEIFCIKLIYFSYICLDCYNNCIKNYFYSVNLIENCFNFIMMLTMMSISYQNLNAIRLCLFINLRFFKCEVEISLLS